MNDLGDHRAKQGGTAAAKLSKKQTEKNEVCKTRNTPRPQAPGLQTLKPNSPKLEEHRRRSPGLRTRAASAAPGAPEREGNIPSRSLPPHKSQGLEPKKELSNCPQHLKTFKQNAQEHKNSAGLALGEVAGLGFELRLPLAAGSSKGCHGRVWGIFGPCMLSWAGKSYAAVECLKVLQSWEWLLCGRNQFCKD